MKERYVLRPTEMQHLKFYDSDNRKRRRTYIFLWFSISCSLLSISFRWASSSFLLTIVLPNLSTLGERLLLLEYLFLRTGERDRDLLRETERSRLFRLTRDDLLLLRLRRRMLRSFLYLLRGLELLLLERDLDLLLGILIKINRVLFFFLR